MTEKTLAISLRSRYQLGEGYGRCDTCLSGVRALSAELQKPEVANRTVEFLLGDPFCIKWGDGVWHCPELVKYFVPRALPLLGQAAPTAALEVCVDANYCESAN